MSASMIQPLRKRTSLVKTPMTRWGPLARNMQPQHAAVASARGSWGVGRDYFHVRVESGQVFDIYYDRAPKGSAARKGAWFLYRRVSG
jgi:hypothetical protein